ncbi:MAG: N-acetylglucosamine-6-phosphate deacetylase [Clostridium sp.]
MLITNCNIIYLDKVEKGSVLIENGKIKEINPSCENGQNIIDGKGLYLAPGFIDVHIHGAGGCDTMDATKESLNKIARTIVKHGTTSFCPTTMTMPVDAIQKAIETIKDAKVNGTDGANVLGAHLEGPFISENAIGAQNPNFLQALTIDTYNKMVGDDRDAVTSITLAPEAPGALEVIKYLHDENVLVSMGHTTATYAQTLEAIKAGASHVTHLFNAMTPFAHREPGVVGAAYDTDITAEVITDGIHISYPALRTTFKVKGTDKCLLVSDAMCACGMADGMYALGGQDVIVANGAARLRNGALAGSVLTIDKAIKNLKSNTSLPLNEIVRMATFNPAVYAKVEDHKGLIKEGYDADLVLFDEDINIKKVIVCGKEIL